MPRLKRVTDSQPGIRRLARGRGFSYLDRRDAPVRDTETLARIEALAIPPAWTNVWICPEDNGHIQATGTDAAGRRQYLYHAAWRERRDVEKFRRVEGFAQRLPPVRRRVTRDLREGDLTRATVLACSIRLLDQAFFRIGSEDYAAQNGSFGLATIRKSHLSLDGDEATFDYTAKSGKRRIQVVRDPDLMPILRALKERRTGRELLAYRMDGRWRDLRSGEINEYLKDLAGEEYSAKDFRTWHATVLAAVEVAASPPATSVTASRRVITETVKAVAGYLGNTPAVARASYIDPRVFDRYRDGITIGSVGSSFDLSSGERVRSRVERAVLELLDHDAQAAAAA
jgi:DNA topoisomerase-1